MGNRKLTMEVEDINEYEERRYAVTVWFASKFDAQSYKAEAKFKEIQEAYQKLLDN